MGIEDERSETGGNSDKPFARARNLAADLMRSRQPEPSTQPLLELLGK